MLTSTTTSIGIVVFKLIRSSSLTHFVSPPHCAETFWELLAKSYILYRINAVCVLRGPPEFIYFYILFLMMCV